MSKSIKHLSTLYNNPFVLGHVLYSFYKTLGECCRDSMDKSILLSYLVFPLSLYPSSQQYLIQRRHRNSCLRILAKEHDRLFGLQERIHKYKTLTNITMQYACDLRVLSITQSQSVKVLTDWPAGFAAPPNASKAAGRLGEFVCEHDIPTSYRMLGVKAI